MRKCMGVSPGQKKSGRNNEVVVRRGSTVHTNKTHFHKKRFALSLFFESGSFLTRKWMIAPLPGLKRLTTDLHNVLFTYKFIHLFIRL